MNRGSTSKLFVIIHTVLDALRYRKYSSLVDYVDSYFNGYTTDAIIKNYIISLKARTGSGVWAYKFTEALLQSNVSDDQLMAFVADMTELIKFINIVDTSDPVY